MSTLQRDNHYVSQAILRRFCVAETGRVWVYRTLVPDRRVPLWKASTPKGIAYHRDFYTRALTGRESDDVERWMNAEFESPAEEAICKAVEGRALSVSDWHRLIRYAALHDVRNPRHLAESYRRWETLPQKMSKWLEDSVAELERDVKSGEALSPLTNDHLDSAPIKINVSHEPGAEFGTVQADVLSGRALWLHEMKLLLTSAIREMVKHRWTILTPPEGLLWVSSDAPFVKLNYYKLGRYNFGGGWGSKGSELLFPLDSKHLLYTQIGNRHPPSRGATVAPEHAALIRKVICEHAYRFVFASTEDSDVPILRPRIVDSEHFHHEQAQWENWHSQQSAAEREF